MPTYVDFGVVRIQRYLSRTPTLRGRRNASAALANASAALGHATASETLCLTGRAKPNREAGQIDGVLSLTVEPGADIDALVRDVLGHLRRALPGAEFQVVTGTGEDYLAAYTDTMRRVRESGTALVDLPAGAEFPLAALCGICRVDPAVGWVSPGPGEDERPACDDCQMRHRCNTDQEGRTAEHKLREAVGARAVPKGFNDLAELAGAGNKEHLATVHADGNNVGAFFDRLAKAGGNGRVDAVERLTTATFEALAAATCAVRKPDDGKLCVVTHLLGGDDVLVSVPADRAWRFTETFVDDFGQRMKRLVRDLNRPDLRAPTMSAGLVFGRRDFPFALSVERAEGCLRMAKSADAGRSAWIGFADVVPERGGTTGEPVSLADLKTFRAALSAVTGLPRANQYRLGDVLTKGGPTAAKTLATRLGHTAVIDPFLDPGGGIDLAQALRIARWWPR